MAENQRLLDVLILPADKHGPRFRPIIQLVDSVHSIRTPYRIPVRVTRNRQNQGEYHYRRGSFEPDHIEISRINDSMEATLLHEVGHFLEQSVIPGCSFGQRNWSGTSLLGPWLESIRATRACELLRQIHESDEAWPADAACASAADRVIRRRWVAYLMLPRELWARGYAQWIVDRGDHRPLRRVIDQRGSPASAIPLQWGQDDFAPVAEQFDRLFTGLGWLR